MEKPITEQTARPLADWTRLLAHGDDSAWSWFHANYYFILLRYAAHRAGDVNAASDIVQQSYLRIARHAKSFVEEEDFSYWLFCIVRCAAMDHTRQRARRSLLSEKYAHWRATHDSDHDWYFSANQRADLTREALSQMPAEDSELLRRKYCEGCTTEELASELGSTIKTIEHRLARLRGLLKDIILRIQ